MPGHVLAVVALIYFSAKACLLYPLGWHDKLTICFGLLFMAVAFFTVGGSFVVAGGDHPYIDSATAYLAISAVVGITLGGLDLLSGAAWRRHQNWRYNRMILKVAAVEPRFAEVRPNQAAR